VALVGRDGRAEAAASTRPFRHLVIYPRPGLSTPVLDTIAQPTLPALARDALRCPTDIGSYRLKPGRKRDDPWMNGDYELRHADAQDLGRLVELAAKRREAYERFQPRFWRPAVEGRTHQHRYFAALLTDHDALVMVGSRRRVIDGFVIARLVPPPPVYDPGGLTCLVDDFIVGEPGEWVHLGELLLEAARAWGASRGAVQVVVVTAHLDEPKRAALRGGGLSIASEWWVGEAVASH
jgi:hypothetical protein